MVDTRYIYIYSKKVKSINSYTSFTTKKTVKFYQESTFRSKNLIYLLECTRWQKQYLEKSECPFYFTLVNN